MGVRRTAVKQSDNVKACVPDKTVADRLRSEGADTKRRQSIGGLVPLHMLSAPRAIIPHQHPGNAGVRPRAACSGEPRDLSDNDSCPSRCQWLRHRPDLEHLPSPRSVVAGAWWRFRGRGAGRLTSWQVVVSLTFSTFSEQVKSEGWSSLARRSEEFSTQPFCFVAQEQEPSLLGRVPSCTDRCL